MRVAYLCSRYPIVSHAFILNEVRALRSRGLDVVPFTVVRVPRSELIEEATRAEDERTVALRPLPVVRFVLAHLRTVARRPRRYAATLAHALRSGPGGLRGLVWQAAYFAQAVLLAAELRRRGIRHVHVHHANVAADVAMLACRLEDGLSWSLSLHGPTELHDVAHFRLADKVADAAWVACISDFARAQAAALVAPAAWDRLHVVRLGVEPEAFAAADRSEPADGSLHVLSVGRLAPQKGQAVLLEAIALLAADGVDVRLTLVGDGPSREQLADQVRRLGIAQRVALAGALGHAELPGVYAAADAFCLTSFAEGIPVVLMEAMASGLPVVAPRINGIPELVHDEHSGLLVAPARPDLVAGALGRIARDEDLRGRLRTNAREAVRAQYTQAASADALHALFTATASR